MKLKYEWISAFAMRSHKLKLQQYCDCLITICALSVAAHFTLGMAENDVNHSDDFLHFHFSFCARTSQCGIAWVSVSVSEWAEFATATPLPSWTRVAMFHFFFCFHFSEFPLCVQCSFCQTAFGRSVFRAFHASICFYIPFIQLNATIDV